MNRVHRILADQLRDALHDHDVTQAELSRRTGISEKHISLVLRGRATASTETWARLLDAAEQPPGPT